MKMQKFDNVDDYISSFSGETKERLEDFRKKIKKLVPDAAESMSYGMPGYKLNGKPLVYFAGWKDHISFYPTPNGMEAFDEELKKYKTGKGTAQFPHSEPIPWSLVEKIVRFRIEEAKEGAKKNNA